MLITTMTHTAPDMTMNRSDAATSRLAGARILVMEKCFEALVDQMIADGSEPANAAVVLAGRRAS